VEAVLDANGAQVEKYLAGNAKIFGFFVGETMKLMKGKGNPKLVNEVLKKKLETRRV
jgi:aspartyl-tRNA(Asn)/glutamyl-tRNA(Gln) amidotransferase subunit B